MLIEAQRNLIERIKGEAKASYDPFENQNASLAQIRASLVTRLQDVQIKLRHSQYLHQTAADEFEDMVEEDKNQNENKQKQKFTGKDKYLQQEQDKPETFTDQDLQDMFRVLKKQK